MKTTFSTQNSPISPKPFYKFPSQSWFKNQVASIWPTLLLVLIIHSSFLQAFKIPSGSMIPTLLIGDRIFVNKIAYALKVPLSDWIGEKPLYLFRTSAPARGDVIVFKYPLDPSIYYVKRVIGLPGDTIEMKNKIIFVNGKAMEQTETQLRESDLPADGSLSSSTHSYLQHYDHTDGTILIDPQNTRSEDFGPVKVPKGNYFCMGDNRDNSSDSRFWKFVPFENIEGKAFLIWFSTTFSHFGTFFH